MSIPMEISCEVENLRVYILPNSVVSLILQFMNWDFWIAIALPLSWSYEKIDPLLVHTCIRFNIVVVCDLRILAMYGASKTSLFHFFLFLNTFLLHKYVSIVQISIAHLLTNLVPHIASIFNQKHPTHE